MSRFTDTLKLLPELARDLFKLLRRKPTRAYRAPKLGVSKSKPKDDDTQSWRS